ncbi:S9 family peptidase [Amycolatopsis sp. NBC_01480]|uniref:S9 family peptidase n=1 Tax=Amycolatopsis sp. NBC_01480 TaxID=2903562 RepID=UPI002E284B0F|nr:S9 family peptidase [Amycolatopsis sp. NBC_01480]
MRNTLPLALAAPTIRSRHGDHVVDEYAWMAGGGSDLIAHLSAENDYADGETSDQAPLVQDIYDEIAARTKQTDLTVPSLNDKWWYYTRIVEGLQHPIYCRFPRYGDEQLPDISLPGEQVLLDGNDLAGKDDVFAVGAFRVSADEKLLAYSLDGTGDERFVLRVKDLRSGELLDDVITGAYYTCAWSLDAKYLFYVTVDAANRPHQVMRHELGTPVCNDALVFQEDDSRFWVTVVLTRSKRFLCIRTSSATTSEVWLLDAGDPTAAPQVFRRREPGVYYTVEHQFGPSGADRLLVLHNKDAANFELSVGTADNGPWTPVIPHDSDTRLSWVIAFADNLVVYYRRGLVTGLRVIDEAGAHEIAFPDDVYTLAPASNPRYDTQQFRLTYSSPITPDSVYSYDMAERRLSLLRRRPVQNGPDGSPYRSEDYRVVREWAVAEDGTKIPITIVSRADLPIDGSAGCVLYGYGSYERPVDMGFSIYRLSLLDRGICYAVAHVRGGGDMGKAWHEAARRLTKKTSFSDYVACAQHLVARRWTSSSTLIARGSSAGGLLVGAAVTMAPEAFGGVIARVPFVDPLTAMLDDSAPLTATERDEWGDPIQLPEVYAYMKSYSPYENVRAMRYPPILAITSLNDTRVRCHEAAKWIARLRARAYGGPFLLKTELKAGHRGRSGRYDAWRTEALVLAWVVTTTRAARK